MTASEKVVGTILDDTSMHKRGRHSVGVARQHTGSAGKITNCQVVVTMAAFSSQRTVLIDTQPYLPQGWADDPAG